MAKQITVYECEYCGVWKKGLMIAERHERACLDNPNGKNCTICKHSKNIRVTDDDNFVSRNVLMCPKLKKTCSRAMSGNCNSFEEKNYDEDIPFGI